MSMMERSKRALRPSAPRSEAPATAHDDSRDLLPIQMKGRGEVDLGRLGAAGILELQGALGNQRVVQLLARSEARAGARAPTSSGAALSTDVRARMESAFGADLSAVRVHEGPQAESLGAVAYTRGTDIHFAPGTYQPHHPEGQRVLGHELAHVIQQSQGRVQATSQEGGIGVNADRSLEREADEMGARAARGEPAAMGGARGGAPLYGASPVAQCLKKGDARKLLAFLNQPKWKDVTLPELDVFLVENETGTEDNPYEKLKDKADLLAWCDRYLQEKVYKDKLKPSVEIVDPPSKEFEEKGKQALQNAQQKLDEDKQNNQDIPWQQRAPQWVPVNGGPKKKEKHTELYRFCTFDEISRILPRLAWESYDDTVKSAKANKKHGANYLEKWNAQMHSDLKDQGLACIDESKEDDFDPSESDAVMNRAYEHMGNVVTRLSPFVSLSEEYSLLANSKCPTIQSIVRSNANLEDVESNDADEASHKFHQDNGVQRASGYQRAPHLVMFEVPDKLIITPEMVDKHKGLSQEDINEGLGLKAMRDAKERLFLGADLWKYAVSVAINPY